MPLLKELVRIGGTGLIGVVGGEPGDANAVWYERRRGGGIGCSVVWRNSIGSWGDVFTTAANSVTSLNSSSAVSSPSLSLLSVLYNRCGSGSSLLGLL